MNVLNIYVMALPADGFIGRPLPQIPTYASLSNGGLRASLEARYPTYKHNNNIAAS